MNLDKYYNDGYFESPYYLEDDINSFDKVNTLYLTKDGIRKIIVATNDERRDILYSPDELILIKFESQYHITPLDLVERLTRELNKEEGPDFEEIVNWTNFYAVTSPFGPLFLPYLDDEYYKNDKDFFEDYLFKKDDHVVSFIVRMIRYNLKEERLEEDLTSYIDFIKDILSQREVSGEPSYKLSTYSLILQSIFDESYKGYKLSQECEKFYQTHLLANAKSGDTRAMRMLGYEYYEGLDGFPLDFKESLYWLEKCFKLSQDPDVTRPIGYIYYCQSRINFVQKSRPILYI